MIGRSRWIAASLVALGSIYLLQLASPLRTSTDATYFLTMGASAADGHGFLVDGEPTHFPTGYPRMVAILDRAGVACSASFIALNLIALAIGLACAGYLLEHTFRFDRATALAICALSLLSWSYIKHATMPLSDMPFLGVSMAAVALLTWTSNQAGRRKVAGLVLAAPLIAASISVRTIGIALIPAWLFACLPSNAFEMIRDLLARDRRRAGLAGIVTIGLGIAAACVVAQTRYFHEMLGMFRVYSPLDLVSFRLHDWGELWVNTSLAQLPPRFRVPILGIGLFAAALVVRGASLRQRLDIVDVYVLAYTSILAIWPYQDARFWVPVLPFLMGYAALAIEHYARFAPVRHLARVYLVVFCLLGGVAITYTTRISLSGERFPEYFAHGTHRGNYRAALGISAGPRPSDEIVDPRVVRILKRYQVRISGN